MATLEQASRGLAETLYRGVKSTQEPPPGSRESNVKDGEVVDAEYAETR
jgi:hypothetical protein